MTTEQIDEMLSKKPEGLWRFLLSGRTKGELIIALKILNEFKSNESREEYIGFPFESWKRLDQLQDYLRLLTDTDVGEVKDHIAIMILERNRSRGTP